MELNLEYDVDCRNDIFAETIPSIDILKGHISSLIRPRGKKNQYS